jgi:sigma-B regulation protein RsbU (phosphoserine phosphatase)
VGEQAVQARPAARKASPMESRGADTRSWIRPLDDEQRRSLGLAGLDILDTPNEERFDRITRLARKVFRTSIAGITLLDGDRAWFKSIDGFPERQMLRKETFCGITGELGRQLVVPDATRDARFASLPGVTGAANIRFYAGKPLLDQHGDMVGVFCLYDNKPRTLGPEELELFEELASWARQELLRTTDMERAKDVQAALLPAEKPIMPGYGLAATCAPSQHVGGDYYDWARTDYGTAAGVADVMGKGEGAAILTATIRAAIRLASFTADRDPSGRYDLGQVMSRIAAIVEPDLITTSTFATVFLTHIEAATGQIDFADAGHGFCLVTGAEGTVRLIRGSDLPLGVLPGSGWTQGTFTLAPGETMLIFSDGLFDLFGGTADAIQDIAAMVRSYDTPELLIEDISLLAREGKALDDVTAVAVRRAE